MRRTLSSLTRLKEAAKDKSMRRRSRLEASLANGRSSARRYLLYGAMIVLSLALPAALTLRGNQSPTVPSSPSPSAGFDGAGTAGGGGGVQEGGVPSTRPREGRDVQDSRFTAVSPLVWRGIADGIASTPTSADDIHVVFSTDCSPYQNYQAILLFHSAEVSLCSGAVCHFAHVILFLFLHTSALVLSTSAAPAPLPGSVWYTYAQGGGVRTKYGILSLHS